jgi:hypothetical protein
MTTINYGVNSGSQNRGSAASKFVVALALLGTVAIVLSNLSIRHTFLENCTVRVIDANGMPVQGIQVSESWHSNSYGLSGGADLFTSVNGEAKFEPRMESRSLLFWTTRPLITFLRYGVHASFGTESDIWISDLKAGRTRGFHCSDRQCNSHALQVELLSGY